jgi:hypothetical protein
LPEPDWPEVIVIQVAVALTAALHAQPVPAVTLRVFEPPAAEIWGLAGDTPYVHGPVWEIEIVLPATVTVAAREEDPVFGATRNPALPLP